MLLEQLRSANVYEEWQAAALELDQLLENDLWRREAMDRHFNWRLVESRADALENAVDLNDIAAIHDLLRSGLSRNLGGILNPKLYNKANAGTKHLIEDYIFTVSEAIDIFARWPATQTGEGGVTPQQKLNLLYDTRTAYGRTALVLQGGSIFGLCHLGVVKSLFARDLLPRLIAGTATGALMAAWVCVHTDDELLDFLQGSSIDLSHFIASSQRAAMANGNEGAQTYGLLGLQTFYRRVRRYLESGFILDPKVLQDCVRANVGDMTFEEAYERTRRVLNITISPSGPGSITLLNYLTAPHVLIWSAAMVSSVADLPSSEVQLYCKDMDGSIIQYSPRDATQVRSTTAAKAWNPSRKPESPLSRLAELFNVNHYVISQARPYIAPFLYPSLRTSQPSFRSLLNRFIVWELQHRLSQLDTMHLLPARAKRLLLDETVPGSHLTVAPEMRMKDWARLLRNPTQKEIDHWIERGEKSVWPHMAALLMRLQVEITLDRGYQLVRRAGRHAAPNKQESDVGEGEMEARRARKRRRAGDASTGDAGGGAGRA